MCAPAALCCCRWKRGGRLVAAVLCTFLEDSKQKKSWVKNNFLPPVLEFRWGSWVQAQRRLPGQAERYVPPKESWRIRRLAQLLRRCFHGCLESIQPSNPTPTRAASAFIELQQTDGRPSQTLAAQQTAQDGGPLVQCQQWVCRFFSSYLFMRSVEETHADMLGVPSPPCSYIEGIVRGYRNGLLTGTNYTNMTQCENIDGNLLFPRPRPAYPIPTPDPDSFRQTSSSSWAPPTATSSHPSLPTPPRRASRPRQQTSSSPSSATSAPTPSAPSPSSWTTSRTAT